MRFHLVSGVRHVALATLAAFFLGACACPFKPKPKVGCIVEPLQYVPVKCPESEQAQVRLAFAPGTPHIATRWEIADGDGPDPVRQVRTIKSAPILTKRPGVYLLAFSSKDGRPPESRTITLIDQYRLELRVEYK